VSQPDDFGEERDDMNNGMPRWVKVFIVVGLLAAAVVLVVLLAGPGGHGPSRHSAGVMGNPLAVLHVLG
jgi:hypothetical protein